MLVEEQLLTLGSRAMATGSLSGKEAQVYLVISGGEERVAKIYKEAEHRTFKHRAEYTEGRGTREQPRPCQRHAPPLGKIDGLANLPSRIGRGS